MLVCVGVVVVYCVLCIFVCMLQSVYVSSHKCFQKVHKASDCTFAFRVLPLSLALVFGYYASIQYCNSNFLQHLNKTFKSIWVNIIDILFMFHF